MSTNLPEWSRLAAAARGAPPDARDASAPHGFATRVAAHAMSTQMPLIEASLFSRYGLRALGISCLLAVAGVAATLRPVMTAIEHEASALNETAVDVDATDIT
jgi:hypothetical protein